MLWCCEKVSLIWCLHLVISLTFCSISCFPCIKQFRYRLHSFGLAQTCVLPYYSQMIFDAKRLRLVAQYSLDNFLIFIIFMVFKVERFCVIIKFMYDWNQFLWFQCKFFFVVGLVWRWRCMKMYEYVSSLL